jgi:hypothetical protein
MAMTSSDVGDEGIENLSSQSFVCCMTVLQWTCFLLPWGLSLVEHRVDKGISGYEMSHILGNYDIEF